MEEKYLRVFCPTHKVAFTAPEAGVIVCASGGESLAQNFPQEEFWEYCCDCQSFWPSSLAKGAKAPEQCLVCERQIKRRFICDRCKVICLESDEATRRKAFTIQRGYVESRCPACSQMAANLIVREHDCEEADVEFTTARVLCPFCEEQIAERPSFPALASEYLEKSGTKKLLCRFDADSNLLLPAPDGKLVLLPSGNGTRLSIVLPQLTRFITKQEFFRYYKEIYDCDEPGAGEVFIVYPAVVDKTEAGWELREVGRLRVKREELPEREMATESRAQAQGFPCLICGTTALPEHTFCKECGVALQPTDVAPPSVLETGSSPSQAPIYETAPTATAQQSSNELLGLLVGVAAVVVIILAIVAVVTFSGKGGRDSSIEGKLEEAITKGYLVNNQASQGQSAYDYYQQLKREGASRTTLEKYESKLLPILTSRPQALIDAWAKPDGKDSSEMEWDEAYHMLSWANEMKSNDSSIAARANYCQGRAAYLSRRTDEAINLWKRASELDRSWALPAKDIGYVYLKDKNFTLASNFLNEAVNREKNWAVPYLFLGDTYYVQKFYSDAQTYYEEAARLAPQWARAHAALGDLAKVRGNEYLKQMNTGMAREEYQKAEQELELALELAAKNPGAFNRKGVDDSLRDVRRGLQQLNGGEEE